MGNRCTQLLKKLSLGKYETKLYYGNKDSSYSSVFGGLITITAVFFLAVAVLTILLQTFQQQDYLITSSYTDIINNKESILKLKISDFRDSLYNMIFYI